MQREDIRQTVTGQFYQALSESGVQITTLPQNQLQAVVNALADGIFAALAAVDAEHDPVSGNNIAGVARGFNAQDIEQDTTPPVEQLLWRGRPYLALGTVYELTNQRLRVLRGLVTNTLDEIELIRIHDTEVKQHVGERLLNVGDIIIFSEDTTTPKLVLDNVQNPIEVRELIRKAVLAERSRRGFTYRESTQ